MNYQGISKYLIIGIALFALISLAFPHASASPIRISQGDTVYLNDTIDISGVVGWGDEIAYCGGYSCDKEDIPETFKLPDTKAGYYNYYIDPVIFGNRIGIWQQWYGEHERAGNLVAFRVQAGYRNTTLTFQNGTVVNISEYESNLTTSTAIKQTILPEKPISDNLFARGDTLTIYSNGPQKIWIFGRVNAVYDQNTLGQNYTVPKRISDGLDPGRYTIVRQYPGKNNDFDVQYTKPFIQWRAGWDGVKSYDTSGIQPMMVMDKVIEAIRNTDDRYSTEYLEVQDPEVTIEGFTEVPLFNDYSRYQEYRTAPGVVSLFDVRGYSNVVGGTNVTIVLDEDMHYPRDRKWYTFHTTTVQTSPGNMSYYQVYVPIIWDEMTVGIHTLKVTTSVGGEMTYNFPISLLPADSYRPNATVKYVMDSNPWKPNMTIPDPIVVKETVVVVKTIEIPVTPEPVVVQQAQETAIAQAIINGMIIVVILSLIAGIGYYGITVLRRARLR